MHVGLVTTFRASRKEPLAELLARIHAAFLASGLGEPEIRFSFADGPVPGFTSSVDRVLKRYPDLQRFESTSSIVPGTPPVRRISNRGESPAAGEAIAFSTLHSIAAGVPRSFPLHNLTVHFCAPAFGISLPGAGPVGSTPPGVIVGDSWWVNGRVRSVSAVSSAEVEADGKALPRPDDRVAKVLAACGKVQSTSQLPLAERQTPEEAPRPATASHEVARAVHEVVLDYRSHLAEVLERAALPHDLPHPLDALKILGFGEKTGPRKPALVRAFKPMGYDCRGGSGTFTLRRRTPGNLTVEISLDVGTWSQSLTAFFSVTGLGFRARLPLPVTRRAIEGGQYRIGGAEHWQQLVENLAAVVAELDRSFVPAVEAAAGPSPEWFKPQQS